MNNKLGHRTYPEPSQVGIKYIMYPRSTHSLECINVLSGCRAICKEKH